MRRFSFSGPKRVFYLYYKIAGSLRPPVQTRSRWQVAFGEGGILIAYLFPYKNYGITTSVE